jgi:exosortase/archaeosortase family protein
MQPGQALLGLQPAAHGPYDFAVQSLSPTFAFALKFMLYFALLLGAFEASRGTALERFLVEDCILKPTIGLVHAVAPHEPIELVGRTITSPNSHLRITRGCEGVEIFLIFVSAIAAFPSSWRAKVRGLALGFLLSYLLSVTRLIALHFTLRYLPKAWEALHGLVLPLGPIIVVMLYFLHWSAGVTARSANRRPQHAS